MLRRYKGYLIAGVVLIPALLFVRQVNKFRLTALSIVEAEVPVKIKLMHTCPRLLELSHANYVEGLDLDGLGLDIDDTLNHPPTYNDYVKCDIRLDTVNGHLERVIPRATWFGATELVLKYDFDKLIGADVD
jgi:hypothetical protein